MVWEYSSSEVFNEGDVESKLIAKLIQTPEPHGWGYKDADYRTKVDLRKLAISKGTSKKLYQPDYAIILDGVPVMIIEAKGPGEDLDEAMREARMYAAETNALYPTGLNPCEIVVVTDGKQIRLAAWDQLNYVSCDADQASPSDAQFAQIAAKASRSNTELLAQSVRGKIRKRTDLVTPLTVMGGKGVANESVGVNTFGANVSVEYQYLFNPQSEEDRDLLVRNAYVPSKRRQSHLASIEKIIRASVPNHLLDANPIEDTSNPKEIIETISSRRGANQLCLLIGSVGSGKSTFTDYVRSQGAQLGTSAATDWVHVNLNNAPLANDEIYKWIITNINNGLKKLRDDVDMDSLAFLMKIYAKPIAALEKGIGALYEKGSAEHSKLLVKEIERQQADKESTLKYIIDHLYRDPGRALIVVLDNCDKRSRDHQLLMFEVANWIKTNFYCMVFLPIRDTTYDNYSDQPPLDTVIKDLVFRIDPPLLERVIQARLEFAIRQISSQSHSFSYTIGKGIRVQCDRDEIGLYLKSIVASVFQNTRFRSIITGLAGRNIRKGLQILLDICKSGHIGEGDIFKSRTVKEFVFPSHLIMQILMKGNRRFYSDEDAHLKSLLHADAAETLPDPFPRLAILRWLKAHKQQKGPNGTRGFHKVERMLEELRLAGIREGSLRTALADLAFAECIYSENSDQRSIPQDDDLLSLSPAGDVHLSLLEDVHYIASVSEAIPFREPQVARDIADCLLNQGRYKADTRSGLIHIAQLSANALVEYHNAFHIGAAKIVENSNLHDFIKIEEVADSINRQAANDPNIGPSQVKDRTFRVGEIWSAVISKKFPTGAIVLFGSGGQAYLRPHDQQALDSLEPGAWIEVKLTRWNDKHSRFDCELAT